jgi:membrane protein DedA with SNARE-associated domain
MSHDSVGRLRTDSREPANLFGRWVILSHTHWSSGSLHTFRGRAFHSGGNIIVLDFLSDYWPLLTTFCLLVAAGIGFPMPEELPVVGAGIWVSQNPNLEPWSWLALPTCILGVVISDGLLYTIGRMYGPRLFEYRWLSRLFPPEKRARIEANFHKYGVKILLFARLLPGIRSPIFITAGIMKLPLKRFLLADGIYAIPGVSLLFFLAFWFGQQFKDLVVSIEQEVVAYRPIIILAGLIVVGIYLVFHFLRKPVPTGDPKELPLIGQQVAATIEGMSPSPAHKVESTSPASSNGQEPVKSVRTPQDPSSRKIGG